MSPKIVVQELFRINSAIWWRHGSHSNGRPSFSSIFTAAPCSQPVFELVVSKHWAHILSVAFQSFKDSMTSAAWLSPVPSSIFLAESSFPCLHCGVFPDKTTARWSPVSFARSVKILPSKWIVALVGGTKFFFI